MLRNMTPEVKYKLGNEAYEKLRTLIKNKTKFENINEGNITTTKEAISMLIEWLSMVYMIDRKEIELDEEGLEIEELFKTVNIPKGN